MTDLGICMACGKVVRSLIKDRYLNNEIEVCGSCYDDHGESMAMDAYYGVEKGGSVPDNNIGGKNATKEN